MMKFPANYVGKVQCMMRIGYIESSRKGTGRISLVQVAPRFGSLELRWTGSSGDFFPQVLNRRKRINASLLRPECILTKNHLFIYFFHLISGLEQCGGSFQNGFYEWVEEARIQKREYRGRNYSGDRFFAGRDGTTMRLFTNVLWNSEMCEIFGRFKTRKRVLIILSVHLSFQTLVERFPDCLPYYSSSRNE